MFYLNSENEEARVLETVFTIWMFEVSLVKTCKDLIIKWNYRKTWILQLASYLCYTCKSVVQHHTILNALLHNILIYGYVAIAIYVNYVRTYIAM